MLFIFVYASIKIICYAITQNVNIYTDETLVCLFIKSQDKNHPNILQVEWRLNVTTSDRLTEVWLPGCAYVPSDHHLDIPTQDTTTVSWGSNHRPFDHWATCQPEPLLPTKSALSFFISTFNRRHRGTSYSNKMTQLFWSWFIHISIHYHLMWDFI